MIRWCARSKLLLIVLTPVFTVLWMIQSELVTKFPLLQSSSESLDRGGREFWELKNSMPSMPDFTSLKSQSEQKAVQIDKTLKHDKWIVVTSIVSPTDDVKFLANLTDWRVVIVGDTKTSSNWSYPNGVYLSLADQENMGLHITTRLPYRSYARNNVGYLFAVAHGAKIIYETDNINRSQESLESFCFGQTVSGLLYAGKEIFNPYRHFGQPTLWPRGYPLGQVGKNLSTVYRLSNQWKTPSIQQGIVNGDPDMDAIFRLTRKKTLSRLDVTFDKAAPPVILPEGVFSPFNSQNTLFLYEALWAMYLPTTTTFRMCDIWRGYWAQRLLWEIGGRLAFFPPNAYQQRNEHSYMADAEDEKDMYFNTQRLIDFLFEWTCPTHFSFFQCVYRLSVDMAEQGFWEVSEVEVVTLWLNDLLRIGFQEPSRVNITHLDDSQSPQEKGHMKKNRKNLSQTQLSSTVSELGRRWARSVNSGSFIIFAAAKQIPPSIYNDTTYNLNMFIRHAESIARLCDNDTQVPFNPELFLYQGKGHFHDILLIVIFNWPYYKNLKYLEVEHRFLFPNIVYCGEKPEQFTNVTSQIKSEFSFIFTPINRGLIGYVCTVKAMQMGYNVKGYLVVGDDDLINTWNFIPFNKDRLWVNGDMEIFLQNTGTRYYYWNHKLGARPYNASLNTLHKIKSVTKGIKSPRFFFRTLTKNLGGPGRASHAVRDVYYIPSRLKNSAIFYLNIFYEQNLMLEIALSTLFFGLEPQQNIQIFHPTDLWPKHKRVNPWRLYSSNLTVLHPVKFSDPLNRVPYCSTYLSELLAWGHVHTKDKLGILQKRFQDIQDKYKVYMKKYLDEINRKVKEK